MSDWKLFYKNIEEIEEVSVRLNSLAESFFRVGNYTIAKELEYYSDKLYKAEQFIRTAVDKNVDNQFQQSQENSLNVLNAVMAGIELEKQRKEKG